MTASGTIERAAAPRRALPDPWDAAVLGAVLAGAWLLKRHYATAGAEELRWVLRPTAALVGALSGRELEAERYVGYVSPGLGVVIVPACAGVNFLIVAWCALAFGFVPRLRAPSLKAGWAIAAAGAAYGATVVVNAVRIAAAAGAHRARFHAGLSAAQMHCALGVAVYLASLFLLFRAAEGVAERLRR